MLLNVLLVDFLLGNVGGTYTPNLPFFQKMALISVFLKLDLKKRKPTKARTRFDDFAVNVEVKWLKRHYHSPKQTLKQNFDAETPPNLTTIHCMYFYTLRAYHKVFGFLKFP